MTRKTKHRLIIFFILFILAGGAGMYYYQTHYIRADFHRFPIPEMTGNLNRPECGWYQLYSYKLLPDTRIDENTLYVNIADGKGYSFRLALLELNLSAYTDKDIDPAAKSNIEKIFQNFAATKMKLIIRFLYDWDGNGSENEPEKKKHIKNHMEQVAEILNDHKDQIYTTQGIFIGSWAEMHGSKYMSDTDMTSLLLTYAKYTDSSIFLAVRTPTHYQTIFRELENDPEKYADYQVTAEDLKKRLGLFNDGIFGSYSDLGTYQTVDYAVTDYEKKLARIKELKIQDTLCRKVPNGGEVIGGNDLSHGKNAVPDMEKMHISYLNYDYDTAVIDGWRNETISETGNLYDGKTYYEYITDHMGARFVIDDCTIHYDTFRGKKATGTITIINKGFSSLYTEKNFSLFLIHDQTKKKTVILKTKDLKEEQRTDHWEPGVKMNIDFSFSPFNLEDGEYDLIASLNEPNTDDEISFANNCYSEESGGYVIGTLTIQRPQLQKKNE